MPEEGWEGQRAVQCVYRQRGENVGQRRSRINQKECLGVEGGEERESVSEK